MMSVAEYVLFGMVILNQLIIWALMGRIEKLEEFRRREGVTDAE
jgi:hypothetical protein